MHAVNRVESAWLQRLTLQYHQLPSGLAFNVSLWPYIKAAWELGVCPSTIATDGYTGAQLTALTAALSDTPGIKIAFNRVKFSLANRASETDGTLETCRALGIGVGPGRCQSPRRAVVGCHSTQYTRFQMV